MSTSFLTRGLPRLALLLALGLVFARATQALAADYSISSTSKYAWAENAGWVNFKPTSYGATLHENGASSYLTGFVWAENVGWIKLAYDANGPYANNSATNWGVNADASGNLSGYGWSHSAGWINFSATHARVTYDTSTGAFSGYAWAENLGYVHFTNASPAYNVAFVLPPTLTTAAASAIGTTSASSGGAISADGGSTVSARGVCWATSSGPTTSDSHSSDGAGTGSFTSALTGLSENTTYYARAYATNEAGTAYGAEISFTTSVTPTPPTVTTSTVSAINATTATGGGNVTSEGSVSVTARGVCWSTSNGPTTADACTSEGSGTGAFSSSLTGLTASTTYYVRAYATNSVGTTYGEELSFTTYASGAVPTVTTSTVSVIRSTTATSGGNVTSSGDSSVTARGVCWSTSSGPTTAGACTSDGTGAGAFTSSLTGLTVSTRYYLRAYATNSQGTAYGDEIAFTSLGVDSGKLILWQNTSTGEIRWWKLNTNAVIYSDEDGVGHGKVSDSTLDGNYTYAGAMSIGGYTTLFFQNTSTGYVTFWQLDDAETMFNSGLVSETVKVNSNWSAAGVMTVDGAPVIIWQNQSTGKAAFWKIGTDCKLISETKDTGWGFISDTVTVNSAWRLAGVTEIDSVKLLYWQNQSSGKVAWWRLTDAVKLYSESKDSGWGFASDTLTLNSFWRLAGISSAPRLIWQNQSSGKVAWWALNSAYKLPSEAKNEGWGFVSENLTLSSAWTLGGVAELNSLLTLIWSNGANGKAAYWKLTSSYQLQNETRDSGWGMISETLTMKSSDNWRMCGVTQ
jgi:hypothetical protein